MKKIKIFITLLLCTAMAAAIFTGCANATSSDGDGTSSGSYIGTKAPSEAKEVGDIVFNDGSAMPYATFAGLNNATKNQKKTSAIALIFYKGTAVSNVAMAVAPAASRTLGVGLVHSEHPWCNSNNANGYNQNISFIRCTPTGTQGNYSFTENSDKDGSDNLEKIALYLNVNGLENDTGVGESQAETGYSPIGLYAPFYFAKEYSEHELDSETTSRILTGSEFENGWYLPTAPELFQIYKNGIGSNKVFDLDEASEALGGDQFTADTVEYWSASQYNDDDNKNHAYTFNFSNGSIDHVLKQQGKAVCAIRAFN